MTFYLNSLRKKKRFSPWLRQDKIKDLDYVKRYYGYSNEKAKASFEDSHRRNNLTLLKLNLILEEKDERGSRTRSEVVA